MRAAFHDNLTLPPGRAALLLIDLQEEQRSDPDYAAEGIETVLTNAARLLDAARGAGWPVAHARYLRDFDSVPPRPFEPVTPEGAPTFSASAATALCAEVAPQEGEAVFVKNDASAFDGTNLGGWLRERRIEWLMICGVWTEACVAATVRDAIAGGFRALLVKDACASGSVLMHQTGVLNLANRLYGGGVCDTARGEALLAGQAARVWRVADPVPFRFTDATVQDCFDQL